MLRAGMALLLAFSCWEPAVAAAVAEVAGARPVRVSSLPTLSVGVPVGTLQGASLSPSGPSLLPGSMAFLAKVPAVSLSAAAAVPVAAAAQAPLSLAGPASAARAPAALASIVHVSGALAQAASRGSPVSVSAAASPVLGRFFDGGARSASAFEPVLAGPELLAEPLGLFRPLPSASSKTAVPAAPVQTKAARRALAGTAIYKFGMESLGITMPLVALTFFGSAVWMATMAAGWGLSMTISSMFAGGLIDRKPVQKVLAGALAVQALTVGGIIALLAVGLSNPWLILPLYSLAGLSQGVVLTARDTLPARMLGRDEAVLGRFNAKTHIIYEVAGTVAPLMVGLLISKVSLIAGLFLQPPAFLLAALAFWRVKTESQPRAEAAPSFKNLFKQTASDVRQGAKVMLGSREFRWLSVMMVAPMVLHRIVEQMLTPLFAKNILHAPAMAAWLVSSSNLGELMGAGLLMALMSRKTGAKPSPLRWMRLMALSMLGAWAFSTGALWLVLPTILCMGLSFAANDIGVSSYFQSRLPNESAGKALGFLMAVELGSIMAVSYGLGFVFDGLPVAAALTAVGVAFTAMAAFFLRGFSRLRQAQGRKPLS